MWKWRCHFGEVVEGAGREALKVMYKRLLVAMFLAVLCVASMAQRTKPASEIHQPRQLQITSTQALTVPVFGYYGYPLADERGDLYVKPSSASDPISIFRLSSDESK